jgi:hypothetical protein
VVFGSSGGDMLSGGNQAVDFGGAAQAATAAQTAQASPGIFGQGGWLERNPFIAGSVIQGLGQGLMADDTDPAEVQIKIEEERAKRIAGNYAGTDPNQYYGGATRATSGMSPAERFGVGEYVFDPAAGRIVYKKQRQEA